MADRLINATDVLNTALNTYPSTMTTGGTASANVAAFAADCAAAAAANKPLWIKPGTYPFGTTSTTVISLAATNGLEIIGNGAVLQVPVLATTSSVVKFTTEAGWTTFDVSAFTWSTLSGGNPTMATIGEVSSLTLSSAATGLTRGEVVSIYSSDPIPYGFGDGELGASQWELNWQHEMSQVLTSASTTSVHLANKTRRNFTTGAPKICKFRRYNNKNIKLKIRDLVLDTISDTWATTPNSTSRPKFVFEIFGFYAPEVTDTVITKSVWQGDFVFAYTVNASYSAQVIKAPNKINLTSNNSVLGYCPGWYGPNLKPRIGPRNVENTRHATSIWSEAGHSLVNGITWAPKAGQVGNGVIDDAFTWATTGTPQVGVYTITMDTATTFTVRDPSAVVVGTGSTGTTFNNQIKFSIKVGTTPFVATDRFDATVAAHTLLGATTTLSHSIACGNPSGAPTPQVGDLIYFRGVSGTLGAAINGKIYAITGYTATTISFAFNSTGLTGFGGEILHQAIGAIYPAGGIHYGECDGWYTDGGTVTFPSGAHDDEHENAIGSVYRNRSFFAGAALNYEDTNGRAINNRGANALYEGYDITGFPQAAQFHSFSQNHGVENIITCRNFNVRNESNRASAGAIFQNWSGDANVLTDYRKLILDSGTLSGGYLIFFQQPVNGPETLIRNWTFSGDWGVASPTKNIFEVSGGTLIVEDCHFDFTGITSGATLTRLLTQNTTASKVTFRRCTFTNIYAPSTSSQYMIVQTVTGCTLSFEHCVFQFDTTKTSQRFIGPSASTTQVINFRSCDFRGMSTLDPARGLINISNASTVITGVKDKVTADAVITIAGTSVGAGSSYTPTTLSVI